MSIKANMTRGFSKKFLKMAYKCKKILIFMSLSAIMLASFCSVSFASDWVPSPTAKVMQNNSFVESIEIYLETGERMVFDLFTIYDQGVLSPQFTYAGGGPSNPANFDGVAITQQNGLIYTGYRKNSILVGQNLEFYGRGESNIVKIVFNYAEHVIHPEDGFANYPYAGNYSSSISIGNAEGVCSYDVTCTWQIKENHSFSSVSTYFENVITKEQRFTWDAYVYDYVPTNIRYSDICSRGAYTRENNYKDTFFENTVDVSPWVLVSGKMTFTPNEPLESGKKYWYTEMYTPKTSLQDPSLVWMSAENELDRVYTMEFNVGEFLIKSVNGFMNFEVYPGFTLNHLLWVVFGVLVTVAIIFLYRR